MLLLLVASISSFYDFVMNSSDDKNNENVD